MSTAPKEGTILSRVEQRGIEPVPEDQRNGSPGQLFWVWFAANISILGIPLGATLIAQGLNLWQAVLATTIGAFGSFALVGIISIAGKRGGAPHADPVPSHFRRQRQCGPHTGGSAIQAGLGDGEHDDWRFCPALPDRHHLRHIS
ncbi:cytosine permease [Bifidobacterium sp. ESL0825]|uniref:cytosine permease n=1 Tax=Bifidobacterium sp. ESL0825 TaxID=3448587 RepID=UPI004041F9DB